MKWQTAAVGLLALAACAAPERALLEQFFGASRLRDLTALQSIATVVFEPRQDGIVRTFDIVSVVEHQDRGEKEVRIEAPVVLPDGRTVQKVLVVSLARREQVGATQWIVTAVRDAEASRAVPPS